MNIEFVNPLYPLDAHVSRAFIEILNLILLSDNVVELNKRLITQNANTEYRSLSGYFNWTFQDYNFVLYQRIAYNSTVCFDNKILALEFLSLVCQDRIRANSIIN